MCHTASPIHALRHRVGDGQHLPPLLRCDGNPREVLGALNVIGVNADFFKQSPIVRYVLPDVPNKSAYPSIP